jgi:hypothetical protein
MVVPDGVGDSVCCKTEIVSQGIRKNLVLISRFLPAKGRLFHQLQQQQ